MKKSKKFKKEVRIRVKGIRVKEIRMKEKEIRMEK
jgi:hypothetical protein